MAVSPSLSGRTRRAAATICTSTVTDTSPKILVTSKDDVDGGRLLAMFGQDARSGSSYLCVEMNYRCGGGALAVAPKVGSWFARAGTRRLWCGGDGTPGLMP